MTKAANSQAPNPAPEGAEQSVTVLTSCGRRIAVPASAIRSHDFRQGGVLTPTELRHITLRVEQFARSAGARLALLLRVELSLQISNIKISAYRKLIETLPTPSHITLFRLDPAFGAGLIAVSPKLGLGLVDRLLGGNGQAPEASRDLSEIETVLTDQITGTLLSDWCGHWTELGELRPAVIGHETNGRFLQGGGEGAMLVLDLNLHIGDQIETVCLAFPYGAMEALVREMASTVPTQQKPLQAAPAAWKPEFNDVRVPATAEWRGVNVTARELAALKPGDVLMLGDALEAEVQVQLNRVPAFRARPGLCGSRWAVQLTAAQE